jgi:mRNA degradation ribonuclease J1/J2
MATKSELVFVALGGLGEIGMNCAMYGVGGDKKSWLMVDVGVSFGGPDTPGIDLIMPDIGFAERERKNLAGIIITHVHEDHYGALVDLWPLAVIGMLASVVSAFYYLRIVKVMYFDEPRYSYGAVPAEIKFVMIAACAFVILLMVYISPVLNAAHKAAASLF